ncbi:MAG: acyltransferase [Pseudoruegeria sp.]
MAQDRMVWLDALRLIAGVSMVGLHASSDAQGLPYPDAAITEKIFPLVTRAFIYTARTELFILISVFLLLLSLQSRPREYASTITQQVKRLLIPFLFWVAFYACWNFIKANAFGYAGSHIENLTQPVTWARYLLLGDVKYHMHFLPTLFGILLFFPLFKHAVKRPWIGFVILLTLLCKREADIYLWSNFKDLSIFPFILRTVKIVAYIGYGFVAASMLGIYQRKHALSRPVYYLILLIGLVLLTTKLRHTYLIATSGTWVYMDPFAYWADYLMPIVLFLVAMSASHKHWPDIISRAAPYSFGIYLCHPIFLDFAEVQFHASPLGPSAQFLVECSFAIIATSFFVIAISRIRSLAWTVGLGPIPTLRLRPFIQRSQEKVHV